MRARGSRAAPLWRARGGGRLGDSGAGNPESALTPTRPRPRSRRAARARGPARAGEPDPRRSGLDGFEARLADLRGHARGDQQVGFVVRPLPVRSSRSSSRRRSSARTRSPSSASSPTTGRRRARSFLEELPLPYPSYLDPDQGDRRLVQRRPRVPLDGVHRSRRGRSRFTKLGPYADEASLAADIDRYAAPQKLRCGSKCLRACHNEPDGSRSQHRPFRVVGRPLAPRRPRDPAVRRRRAVPVGLGGLAASGRDGAIVLRPGRRALRDHHLLLAARLRPRLAQGRGSSTTRASPCATPGTAASRPSATRGPTRTRSRT